MKIPAHAKYQIIYDTMQKNNNLLNVAAMCEIAGVSRSGYYHYLSTEDQRMEREERDRQDFLLILKAYQYRGYHKGARSIYMRLLHMEPPIVMNIKKIRRLMKKYNLQCPIRKANPYRRMAKAMATAYTAPNIVNREFEEHGPRKILLTDITYIINGKAPRCYMSTIIDACTKELLSWVLSESLEIDFVLETVKQLIEKHGTDLSTERNMNNKLEVIGIDHGWSMMKTISQVFVTGVKEITTTPALFGDVLEYEGKFYKVGTVRQEVKDTKVEDDSFYLLTLAAVAKELKRRGLAEAKVFLAVGLPLTRFGAEKNDFIKYLTKNKRVSFKYENESYHIEIGDVAVFPQCYAAVVDKIPAMAKKTLIVDIGSWTIDIMPVINKSPDESKCVTIPKGLITCMRSINEQCVRQLNGEVDESEIQSIMRYGRSDIDDEYFAIIKAEIEDFVDKVYNSIREFGYNLKTTPIVFVGGGAVVMKNFGSHDAKNISYNLDVKANARGYEQLATMGLKSTKRVS